MANDKIINEVMGGGLRALTKLADSPLVERFGLQDRTRQWVFEGARRAAETAKRFAPKGKGSSSTASPKFDLRLSEEQQLMRDTLRRFADDVMRPAAPEADDLGAPPDGFLESFGELGAIPMAIPEALGGAAERVSVVSQMLVAEDLARGDMGLAYAALSSLSFVNALVHWGSEAQQASILRPLADGDGDPATVAMVEPHPLFDPQSLRTTAKMKGGELVLDGEKSLVALGTRARWFLIAAEIPKVGPRLIAVSRDTPGLAVRDDHAMGLGAAALGRLVLRKARVPVDAVLGGQGALEKAGGDAYQDAVNRSRIAWGAMALGTSQAMLDYVIPYCNERIAFGEPISHRQAVAFMIANIAIELESMKMLVYRAAGRIDAGLPCAREAYLARTLCAEKSMEIGTNGVQLLGGAGFVKDHPVETWYRQLRAIGVMDGNLVL
ncbi:MAG: acyl-CoA dehydrogenase family protein [Polyangiales bacterium]